MFKNFSAFTALLTITIAMLATAFVLGLLAPKDKDAFLDLAAPYGAIDGVLILIGLVGCVLCICIVASALRYAGTDKGEW